MDMNTSKRVKRVPPIPNPGWECVLWFRIVENSGDASKACVSHCCMPLCGVLQAASLEARGDIIFVDFREDYKCIPWLCSTSPPIRDRQMDGTRGPSSVPWQILRNHDVGSEEIVCW